MILANYVKFVSSQINQNEDAKTDLKNIVNKYISEVMNSPYVLLSIKFEVINKLLKNEIQDIEDWLKKLLIQTTSPMMEITINMIMKNLPDEDQTHNFLVELFKEDVYSVKFANIKGIPIANILI